MTIKSTFTITKTVVDVPPRRLKSYIVSNPNTSNGNVVVNVLNEIADWIWQQPPDQWHRGPQTIIFYERYTITKELFLLLSLKWEQ